LKVKSALFVVCIIGVCLAAASFAFGEHTLGRVIDTQAMFIRHTATKLQRETAEQNAKAYVAQLAPEKKLALKKKKVQYLAVPTVRSKETSPEAKEVLMIWDVPREKLVGKNVYELTTTPGVGKLATYDNLVAEYVGKPAKDF
jgi:deoxyribodipyrimidine photolyase